jgi:hypothetical protein
LYTRQHEERTGGYAPTDVQQAELERLAKVDEKAMKVGGHFKRL